MSFGLIWSCSLSFIEGSGLGDPKGVIRRGDGEATPKASEEGKELRDALLWLVSSCSSSLIEGSGLGDAKGVIDGGNGGATRKA